jgi:hypothetical protein
MTNLQNRRIPLAIWSFMIVLGANLFINSASAQDLTIPNVFTSGTPAVAAEVNENFDAVATAVNTLGGQTSTADIFTFMMPDETPAAGDVVGTADLTRTAAGVRLTANSTLLDAGAAYTLWWIIFNNPAACDPAGCSDADFGTPAVEASVMNATGRVADANGLATFVAFLPVGFMHTNPSSLNGRQLFGPGLQNAAGAVIHVVIRCHGPSSGDIEQISTVDGDCLNAASPSGCYDAQAIVFPLPAAP